MNLNVQDKTGANSRYLEPVATQPEQTAPSTTCNPRTIMNTIEVPQGLDLLGPVTDEQSAILCPEALEFFATLQREFNSRRLELLEQRKLRERALARGA